MGEIANQRSSPGATETADNHALTRLSLLAYTNAMLSNGASVNPEIVREIATIQARLLQLGGLGLVEPVPADILDCFDALRAQVDSALSLESEQPLVKKKVIGLDGLMPLIELIAKSEDETCPVLVLGETGVGKEVVARQIHASGPRAGNFFVTINCAGLPSELLESELFGHRKGAFTGAVSHKKGLVEEAEGGTLFLDEIGEISLQDQAKLLRFLQDGTYRPVGGARETHANVRVIAATNRDLKAMVAEGKFRDDLLFRLSVFPLEVPPLRLRREEIWNFVQFFLDKYGKGKKIITVNTWPHLVSYPWPGNVREVESVIRRACIVSGVSPEIRLEHLNIPMTKDCDSVSGSESSMTADGAADLTGVTDFSAALIDSLSDHVVDELVRLYRMFHQQEGIFLAKVKSRFNGSSSSAANALGLNRTTFHEKLRRYLVRSS